MVNNKKYEFSLPIGTKLKGAKTYHIEEVLGQGGYGITYKVWAVTKEGQIPVKVPFAIKEHFVNGRCHRATDGVTVEYSQEAAEDVEESLKDFVKEGRLLNGICQSVDEAVRYIVPVNEVIEVNNTAYFVMQYLEGGSLRRMVLNSGALPEEEALALMKPIVRAVDFIHRHKVLHMDIKPENIVMHRNLLTGLEEPVLIDFGVSLHFNKKGGLTSKHTSFGHTEGFSPIEQYGAMETFAPWVDVYALGATLYYLLTGKTPPKAFDLKPEDIGNNLPPNVGQRTRAAIMHAMAKDYRDRTQSASTFLWELENDYEPEVKDTSDTQPDVEDNNLTVKKKSGKIGNSNSSISVPPTPHRKWTRLLTIGGAIILIVLVSVLVSKSSLSGAKEEVSNSVVEPKGTIKVDKPKKVRTVVNHVPTSISKPTVEQKPTIRELSNEEKFKTAKAEGNIRQITALAEKGYTPACDYLAQYYIEQEDNSENCKAAKKWASKASSSVKERVLNELRLRAY